VPLKSTGHHNIRTGLEEVEEPMAMGESVRATAMAKVQADLFFLFFFFQLCSVTEPTTEECRRRERQQSFFYDPKRAGSTTELEPSWAR
jgi:hypothetical protein